jgi:FKBP-type peptidyl-prolyl cis-trans isomerase (trigger factor)
MTLTTDEKIKRAEQFAKTRITIEKVLSSIIDIEGFEEFQEYIEKENSQQQSLYGFFTISPRFTDDNLTEYLEDMVKIMKKLKEVKEIVKDNRILVMRMFEKLNEGT